MAQQLRKYGLSFGEQESLKTNNSMLCQLYKTNLLYNRKVVSAGERKETKMSLPGFGMQMRFRCIIPVMQLQNLGP